MGLTRAVQVKAPGAAFELVQKEIPVPKENEVLIKVEACGICRGDVVAVLGLGGLGHLAVQFARKLGFYTVALSRGKEKADLAHKLGAYVTIDTSASDPAAEMKKLGGAIGSPTSERAEFTPRGMLRLSNLTAPQANERNS